MRFQTLLRFLDCIHGRGPHLIRALDVRLCVSYISIVRNTVFKMLNIVLVIFFTSSQIITYIYLGPTFLAMLFFLLFNFPWLHAS